MRKWLLNCLMLGAVVLLLNVGTATAQIDFLSKFYRDQRHKSVRLPPISVEGMLKEGKVYLTEREAIEMALRYNLGINVQRIGYLYDNWTIRGLEGVYDPQGIFGLNWRRQTTPTASVLSGGEKLTDVATNLSFGYQQLWSTGTTLNVTFTGARDRSTNTFSSLIPAINTGFEVMVTQDLMQGFGRILPDYQIEISRNNLEISLQEFRALVAATILQVQTQYWELAYAIEDIEVKKKSLEAANTLLEQNRAKLQVGTGARLDVTQSEAQVALSREQLIASQYNYRLAQDQFIGLITDYRDPRRFPGEVVPAEGIVSPPPVGESFDQLEAAAFRQRPELQQADLQIRNAQVTLDQSRNQLKPNLNLQLGYQQFGLGGTQIIRDYSQGFINPPIVDIIPGGLPKSLSELTSGKYYGYVVQANLQFPIFNTEARARSAQAQLSLNQTKFSKDQLQQSVSLQIRQALTQIDMNRASLEAAIPGVRAAQEALEGEQAKFQAGLATTRNIIDAQRDLLQAEETRLRAQINLIQSYSALDQSVGRSLERNNIRLQEAVDTNVQ
jgi:outer membrane protein